MLASIDWDTMLTVILCSLAGGAVVVVFQFVREGWQRRKVERRFVQARDRLEQAVDAARETCAGQPEAEEADPSRRQILATLGGGAAVGGLITQSLQVRDAQAAMAVFDAANLAKAAEVLQTATEQLEMLTDLARLDQLALKALGEIGVAGDLANQLFRAFDAVGSMWNSVQRLRQLPHRVMSNLNTSIGNFQNIGERIQTIDGARGVFTEIYGRDDYTTGREVREIELVRADALRTALIDAVALATSSQAQISESAEQTMRDLGEQAASAARSNTDGGNLRQQMAVLTSVSMKMTEEMMQLRAITAAGLRINAAHIGAGIRARFVDAVPGEAGAEGNAAESGTQNGLYSLNPGDDR